MTASDSHVVPFPNRRLPPRALPLPDEVALVLQGGGALGAYQAGVYEALHEAAIEVDQVAGISIGAVNAAIIAGNPPERRVERLRMFWDRVTAAQPSFPIWLPGIGRELLHEMSAALVMMFGVPGMFRPRLIPPLLHPAGLPGALSVYDPAPLRKSLEELVDWDLLNDGPVTLAVGAVEVDSGNMQYFSTAHERLDVRHIMASGALPPAFPPVEIDGRQYWDGGLVSNTPLSHVLDEQDGDLLIFQVDLFSAQNDAPRTMSDVVARAKEIQFSSRTRQISDLAMRRRGHQQAIARLIEKLPPELANDPDAVMLRELVRDRAVSLVQLIYRANAWENGSRDYEFSARTMAEHWAAGRASIAETMTKSELIARNIRDGTSATFDLAQRGDGGTVARADEAAKSG